ncbi:Reverse transcriptase zinc-binding domain [Sesbania bispinosa]|nr:Reverse transcriptase zinc-binding domain [Sesbania bispinosa]
MGVHLRGGAQARDSLPTRQLMVKRGVPIDPICARCGQSVEDQWHCIRDCAKSASICHLMGLDQNASFMDDGCFRTWLQNNFKQAGTIFLSTLWEVWNCRNGEIFNDRKHSLWDSARAINILSETIDSLYAWPVVNPTTTWVKWSPPSTDHVMLNTDGSVSNGMAGYGGLIRDSS